MNLNNINPAFIFVAIIVWIFLVWTVVDLDNFILFKWELFRPYQLITSSFLHLNFQHLVSNAIWLLVISRFTEDEDIFNFSIMWLVFALWWSVFSFVFEKNPVLWASWVVLWFLSYYFMLYREKYDMSWLYVVLILNIGIWFLPWISLWAHVWGAVFWILYYYFEGFISQKN